MNKYAAKLPTHKSLEATLKEANANAGLKAGKATPIGQVVDRTAPKVTANVSQPMEALASANTIASRKVTQ